MHPGILLGAPYDLTPGAPSLYLEGRVGKLGNAARREAQSRSRHGGPSMDTAVAPQTGFSLYQAPRDHYLAGEPLFIGDPSLETAGAAICQIFDAQRVTSAFAIFDAFNVARGPLATLHLREPIHHGFHASFDSDFVSLSH